MFNKLLMLFISAVVLLSACGTDSSWEEEEVVEESNRIITEDVDVDWEIDKELASGKENIIQLTVSNNGESVDHFEVNHEKLLHLILVSKDLSYFNHIHPEYKGDGVFEVKNKFPAGGEYRMVADFKPTNGSSMSKMAWETVEGDTAQPIAVTVDENLEKTAEGMNVALSIEPGLAAGEERTMKFTLTEGDKKLPVTDLEPYLGSIGHVVVLSEDGERYLHVHALEGQGSGPEALFETEFPESGIYKIWGQFQRNGKVVTVPFVVEVP
ncbi:COMM domain-containing protein [Bacillus sp. Y1]|nr:COMM domain-containing protein [Bacillus sp. Y1]